MCYKGINIQNVYYMLAYAFNALREGVYADFTGEDFDGVEDLLGEILAMGISAMLKRGSYRTYVQINEDTQRPRGRIDLVQTFRNQSAHRNVVTCLYDEYTVNNPFNQIIKSTALALLRTRRLKKSGAKLKLSLAFLGEVDEIFIRSFPWEQLRYDRNNHHYLMLINVCKLVADGLILQEGNHGEKSARAFSIDKQRLAELYENFIRAYYVRHYSQYNLKCGKRQISWDVPQGTDKTYLPNMESDVMISGGAQTFIIDAKFYEEIMQNRTGKETIRSAHLYQLFAYVYNHQMANPNKTVSGMLLYAKTEKSVPPSVTWRVSGYDISVETLDLAKPFREIAAQLDDIIQKRFKVQKRM